jgi:predicted flap endonuclease-1-like 5' DNA nuclease
MTWLTDDNTNAARERAAKAMAVPLGLASPLWIAFGAAASVGAAWWWMTRWTRAVNLEAMAAPAAPALSVVEPAFDPILAPEPTPEPTPEPSSLVEAAEAATAMEPDDLTRLVGIGPKLAQALAARGVTRFSELAAWTAADLAEVDAALSLKGRAVRDAWVAQARRFASAAVN